MAEETAVTTERLEIRLDRLEQGQLALRQDVDELKGDVRRLHEPMARLVGVVEQLSQRVGNIEQGQRQMQGSLDQNTRWLIGLVLGSWVTLGLAILGIYLRL